MQDFIKSNVCHLPWTGLEVTSAGEYKPCCLYQTPLKDKDNKHLNATKHSIRDALHSQEMEDLRTQFRENKKPKGCEKCWKEESAGKKSKRILMWEKSPILGELHFKKDTISPRYLEIKLGNICNLKCRICGPDSSSLWANEEIKSNPNEKGKFLEINEQSRWPRKQNKLFSEIDDVLQDVRYLQITGGEPFLIQEQFDVLQKCIDLGVAHKIEVHYNTNGTTYPEQAIKDIWPHFKRIELAVSIDDIGNRFEYQRHPADWKLVNSNIIKIKKSGLKNLSLQICTTLNFFNAYYLDELAHKIDEWGPDFWHINSLHYPTEFDVQQLDQVIKDRIIDKLLKCKTRKDEIDTALRYIKARPLHILDNSIKTTISSVKRIDKVRNEVFEDAFPEFYSKVLNSIGNNQ